MPADDIIGLYNPFRDLYSASYPNGIPYKNPLITDPVRQQYPWKKLATDIEKKIEIPLWNPYSMSGTPLLANFQSSPFYPLNILLIILPFNFGWSLLIMSQVILGSMFMYLYLKNQNLENEASVLGSVAFAFSGFSIAWLEWGTILSTALWAPLILLSIDKMFEGNKKWTVILVFSLAFSFFAGHLQLFFYSVILYVLYSIFNFLRNPKTRNNLWLIVAGCIVSFVIVFPQALSTFQFIILSSRSTDLNWKVLGWFIPPIHLIQFIIPDFFGNPATLNYFGVWNYGELVGYIGIFPLMMAFLSIFSKKAKIMFFWLILLFSLIFALPTFFAQIPYQLNLPFISTAQPTRLLFLIDLSLAICAAFGLDYLMKNKSKKQIVTIIGIFSSLFLLIIALLFLDQKLFANAIDLEVSKRNLYFPLAIFVISSLGIIVHLFMKNKQTKNIIVLVLILITIFDLFRFGWKFTPFTNQSYIFPPTKILSFLQNQNDKNFRIMSLDSQIMPPNFSVAYNLQDVSGYDPLYLLRYGEFISAMQRNKPDITPPFGFDRLITPNNISSPIFLLLNVKYLLTFSNLNNKDLNLVMKEGKTNLYEEKNLLPRTFFVSSTLDSSSKQEVMNDLYEKGFNPSKSAVVENYKNSTYSLGRANIDSYSENRVEISTNNQATGFLVLLDTNYPTWKVYIDGKLSKIYTTDYNFRGVEIPAGNHKVIFEDSLL